VYDQTMRKIGKENLKFEDLDQDQQGVVKKFYERLVEFKASNIRIGYLAMKHQNKGGVSRDLQAKIVYQFQFDNKEEASSCYCFFAYYSDNLQKIERGEQEAAGLDHQMQQDILNFDFRGFMKIHY
jgi:hypothetical protein